MQTVFLIILFPMRTVLVNKYFCIILKYSVVLNNAKLCSNLLS